MSMKGYTLTEKRATVKKLSAAEKKKKQPVQHAKKVQYKKNE